MKKHPFIVLCAFLLICSTANAQFKKPLTSPREKAQSRDARFNVGLVGGGNATFWFHFNNSETSNWYLANYKPQLHFGYFGGLALEYMWAEKISFGLNAVYAQHNSSLFYSNENFPTNINQHIQRKYDFVASYQSVEVYVPVSFYFTTASKNIRPYIYAAPRVSYILGGEMSYTRTDLDLSGTQINSSTETTPFGPNTYIKLNAGATIGAGSAFRINTNNYYFLLKFDVSANLNALSTFTEMDLQNEFNFLRYNADAHASLTFMVPIKKRLVGACVKWGEYD